MSYTRRINFSADGEGEGGSATQTIDFAANESAFIEHMKAKGYEIETKEGIQSKFVSPAVQKTHNDWETAAGEGLGESKPAGEKGLNWFKKTLPDKIKPKTQEEEKKVETEKPVQSVTDDVSKAAIKILQDKLDAMEKAKNDESTALAEKTVNTNLRGVLRGVKFNAESEEDEASRRSDVEKLIKANYTVKLDDSDEPVLYDKDGPVMDPETGKPIAIDKLVKKKFSYMISAEKVAPIGGTGTNKETIVTKVIDGVNAIVATSVTDLRNKLLAKALIPGGKEYNSIFYASCKASNLDPDGR